MERYGWGRGTSYGAYAPTNPYEHAHKRMLVSPCSYYFIHTIQRTIVEAKFALYSPISLRLENAGIPFRLLVAFHDVIRQRHLSFLWISESNFRRDAVSQPLFPHYYFFFS